MYFEFYGNLVHKLKKIVGSVNFSAQFIKIISHYLPSRLIVTYLKANPDKQSTFENPVE